MTYTAVTQAIVINHYGQPNLRKNTSTPPLRLACISCRYGRENNDRLMLVSDYKQSSHSVHSHMHTLHTLYTSVNSRRPRMRESMDVTLWRYLVYCRLKQWVPSMIFTDIDRANDEAGFHMLWYCDAVANGLPDFSWWYCPSARLSSRRCLPPPSLEPETPVRFVTRRNQTPQQQKNAL